MTIVIEFYFLVCVALLLFDISFLIVKNSRLRIFKHRFSTFEKNLNNEILKFHENGVFSTEFLDSLPKKLASTKNMVILATMMEQEPTTKTIFRPYVTYELNNYKKKSDYEQAFYAYVISVFDYSKENVRPSFANKFLTLLDTKSLYTFANTMEALYAFGDEKLLLQALHKVDERQGFYHKKLLVDGLLSAKVNFNSLNPQLVDRFYNYSPFLQDCLLDFFRMNRYDVTLLCTDLLYNQDIDAEVRYNAMRYFSRFPTVASKKYFINILKEPNTLWIDQLLAIQALENYLYDVDIINLMWTKVTNPKWFVRTNAIHFLFKHGMEKSDVCVFLQLRDQFATEALLYEFRDDDQMTQYILDTTAQIKQCDEALANTTVQKKVTEV